MLPITGTDQPAGRELQACSKCKHAYFTHYVGSKHKGEGECKKCGCSTFQEGFLKTIFETHEEVNSQRG